METNDILLMMMCPTFTGPLFTLVRYPSGMYLGTIAGLDFAIVGMKEEGKPGGEGMDPKAMPGWDDHLVFWVF